MGKGAGRERRRIPEAAVEGRGRAGNRLTERTEADVSCGNGGVTSGEVHHGGARPRAREASASGRERSLALQTGQRVRSMPVSW